MATTPRYAVLFDLDGTLLDTIELLLSSVRYAFRAHGDRAPIREDWIAGIGTPLVAQMRQYARDDAELATLITDYRTFQNQNHDALTRAYTDAVETVADLYKKGHRMGIVTSKANDIANRSLRFVGLDRYLEVVVGYDSTDRHKPDPTPVTFALSALGVPKTEAIFVGDSPDDILAGNAAGVISVGALWGPFSAAALAHAAPRYTIASISELPKLLETLPPL